MDAWSVFAAILLNAVLLAVIVFLLRLWRKRQPMTGARLRKAAEKAAQPVPEAPFAGNFVRMRALLEALDGNVPDERTVTALLLGWAAEGQIRLCETDKKRLKSFGAERQATVCFPGDEEHPFTPAGEARKPCCSACCTAGRMRPRPFRKASCTIWRANMTAQCADVWSSSARRANMGCVPQARCCRKENAAVWLRG